MLDAMTPFKVINEIHVKKNINAEKPVSFIQLNDQYNTITFKMQKDEKTRDGCGIEEVLEVGKILIQKKYLDKPNDNILDSLYHMRKAIKALQAPRLSPESESM